MIRKVFELTGSPPLHLLSLKITETKKKENPFFSISQKEKEIAAWRSLATPWVESEAWREPAGAGHSDSCRAGFPFPAVGEQGHRVTDTPPLPTGAWKGTHTRGLHRARAHLAGQMLPRGARQQLL